MRKQNGRFAWLHWLWISVVVLVIDQITKQAITASFQYGESKYIFSWFNLVLAHNSGAAFSFLASASGWQREFFVVLTTIISCVLLWMLKSNSTNRMLSIALALVLGGAFGNLYDRVQHGYVIDFVQWHVAGYYWPAFNVADSAICLGAVMLVLDSFRRPAVAPTHPPSKEVG
ncbi:MAG: lipoprotein signal peptidase [Aeromicrobium sp.]|nr:lipoprotein signal peptidase [Burkholderiales bacterium]